LWRLFGFSDVEAVGGFDAEEYFGKKKPDVDVNLPSNDVVGIDSEVDVDEEPQRSVRNPRVTSDSSRGISTRVDDDGYRPMPSYYVRRQGRRMTSDHTDGTSQ
jgi:hypothetical protein